MRAPSCLTIAITFLAAGCGARSSLAGSDSEGAQGGEGGAASASSSGDTASSSSSGTGAGGSCEDGSVLIEGGRSGRVEVRGGDVYFTEDVGRVLRAPRDGSSAPTVVVDLLAQPGDIAIYDGILYASDLTRIIAVPIDGSTPPTTLYEGSGVVAAFLEVDETGIYWLSLGTGIASGALRRLGFGDAAPVTLVDHLGQPGGFAIFEDQLVFTAATLLPTTELNNVASVPKAGGVVTILASGRQSLGAVFPVRDRIGWIETFSATLDPLGVYTRSRNGNEPAALLLAAPPDELPVLARADGDSVFMTTFNDSGGAIYTSSLDDPRPVLLDRRPEFFIEPAVTSDFVAWSVQPLSSQRETVDARWLCRSQP